MVGLPFFRAELEGFLPFLYAVLHMSAWNFHGAELQGICQWATQSNKLPDQRWSPSTEHSVTHRYQSLHQ